MPGAGTPIQENPRLRARVLDAREELLALEPEQIFLGDRIDQIGVAYGRQGAAQRHARGIRNRLEHSNMNDIFQHGVHEFIQEFLGDNARLGEIISRQYLI